MYNFLKSLFTLAILFAALFSFSQGLKRSGQKIVDQNGNEVQLRGMGLGGWMLQEPYMMEMSGFASAQWEIKSKIKDLIGAPATDAFYDSWLANHMIKGDVDSLASWGFNSVRLPMHYNLYTLPIEEEPVPGNQTWLAKGFALTDSLIKWCSAKHIYVFLDLHAAPGGEGKNYSICDGDPSKPSLWESDANKQKTIALWRKLAERYAGEPWVGGYDLLNEPNWSFTAGGNENGCTETSNAPLRQLLVDITNAIRQVDPNHLIIIEGNCWGNNYSGMFPVWDLNMALSFHKYWSYNDQNSIQSILDMRSQYNVPVWLGESGENSNVWFTEAIRLFEKNKMGWSWWPLKKINSVVGPLTIVKTSGYQTLLDFWNNGGTQPSVAFATNALMQMAANSNIANCVYHKDVIDAMFRQVYNSTTMPYAVQIVPGVVHAPDYDLGRCGKAYWDTDTATYQGNTGIYTAWNSGWVYRNDGVDIETSTDGNSGSNGYDVGWIADKEWLQYTVRVDSSAAYVVQFHYSALNAGAMVKLIANESDITGVATIPASGGYQTWNNLLFTDVILYKGVNKLKVYFEKGGVNFGFLTFTISKAIADVQLKAISAETYKETQVIYLNANKILVDSTVTSDGFSCTVNGSSVGIVSLSVNPSSPFQIMIGLGSQITDADTILLSYSNGHVKATDGTSLTNFNNLRVKNNLPVHFSIPGKIEAEAFTVNQGLQLETCTDVGGGQDVGFTNAGDYLEYSVRVLKTANYNLEVRIACLSNSGTIEVQQINSYGAVINTVTLTIPVTGGWQTWRTTNKEMHLNEGICTLRVKIIKPEFNTNWFKFTEQGIGFNEIKQEAIKIFPNPAKDELTIEIPGSTGQKKTVLFRTLNGVTVKELKLTTDTETQNVEINGLAKGFYLVDIIIEGKAFHEKLIIQ